MSPTAVRYPVCIEIAGPLAMFARPDTGGTPTSYPVPTWSACKGIFESIAMLASGDAWICPMRVEVCRSRGVTGGNVRLQRYTTNYGGPLRKRDLVNSGSSMQLFATVLADVCYRLHGGVRSGDQSGEGSDQHYLQDLFTRRLTQGRCYRTPSLGWREFTCSYWGNFREDAFEVDRDLNLTIPSMLRDVWSSAHDGRYAPRFDQNVKVLSGVLSFVE